MQIRRTIKDFPNRAKSGEVEFIDEAKMREIAGQTNLGFMGHGKNKTCTVDYCVYCPEPAMSHLAAGHALETFYAFYELVPDESTNVPAQEVGIPEDSQQGFLSA